MRAFVIFALLAVVAARPDISQVLQQQEFNQGGNTGSSSDGNSFSGASSDFGVGSNSDGTSSRSFEVSDNFGGQFSSDSGAKSFNGASFDGASVIDGGVHQGESQVIDISSGASAANIVYKPVIKQGPPQITKSVYIHEAPEDKVDVEVQEKEINVRPQKHYKIIFIKVPAAETPAGAGGNALVYPQNEEKTIVYVLSKKPEGSVSGDVDFPTPPPAVVSKPDVFFVKYRTQQEADGAISTIQESFKEGGAGYNDPAQFAESLGASISSASASSFSQGGAFNSRNGKADQFGEKVTGLSTDGSETEGSFDGVNTNFNGNNEQQFGNSDFSN